MAAGALALLAGLVVFLRPVLVIALAGSGNDPRIPRAYRVAPSVDSELREHGALFEKRVYQVGRRVRVAVGFGLANLILVEGDDGVVVVDTGETLAQAEEVRARFRAATQKPVQGVILTHHHADHVLGTSAFVSAADSASGKVPVIAHDSLLQQYADETGLLAELQTVRSAKMYGAALLFADKQGSNAGIGPWLGRGARSRDPVRWVRSLDLLRELGAESMVLAHGPPVEGKAEVARVLTLYRDQIQYVHDQTVRRMNQGLSPAELAEAIRLSPQLAGERPWGQEFYGTVSHAVRNIYGTYEGWFAGDPVDLAPTPRVESARRTVGLMGGREAVLAAARQALAGGDPQFAA